MTVTIEVPEEESDPFHRGGNQGQLVSCWRIDNYTIDALNARLNPGMRTVETGAGLSTVLFALHATTHRCIVPDAELVERIKSFCREHDISTENVTFNIVPSHDIVASLEPHTYDLALIDGLHSFPIAVVDFFYAARALKTGGTLVIDDLHIWTCDTIARFLRESPTWRVTDFTRRVCFAVREGDAGTLVDWRSQPYVWSRSLARSRYIPQIHAFRMALRSLREWLFA